MYKYGLFIVHSINRILLIFIWTFYININKYIYTVHHDILNRYCCAIPDVNILYIFSCKKKKKQNKKHGKLFLEWVDTCHVQSYFCIACGYCTQCLFSSLKDNKIELVTWLCSDLYTLEIFEKDPVDLQRLVMWRQGGWNGKRLNCFSYRKNAASFLWWIKLV